MRGTATRFLENLDLWLGHYVGCNEWSICWGLLVQSVTVVAELQHSPTGAPLKANNISINVCFGTPPPDPASNHLRRHPFAT